MDATIFRGVFPILLTPFDEAGQLDEASLRREIDYIVEAGAHGVGVALGSEIYKLLEAERERLLTVVIDQVGDRLPVVINTGAAATDPAVYFSRQAERLGAAAVMCTPPAGASGSETRAYFRAISDAISIPIFVQDTAATPAPASLIRQMAAESERVRYAKIESSPPPQRVQEAVAAAGDSVTIFGGAAGAFLLEELRRGALGTMPWPSTPAAFVRVWDHWQAGDEAAAQRVFEAEIGPLVRLSNTALRIGHQMHKEVLRRQGVIATAHVRGPADPLDAITLREMDAILRQLGIGAPA